MNSAFGNLRLRRLGFALALSLSLGASWAAVSVTDISVTQSGNNLVLSYRLNEPATSVNVVVGAQTFPGTTTKGLNAVNLSNSLLGQSATITATAPAENGTGGAVVLVPFTQDAAANRYSCIDWVKRSGSASRDHLYIAAGFLQSTKTLYQYAADGSLVAKKDLLAIINNGSWPFGLGVSPADPHDYVYVVDRSDESFFKFNPQDLSVVSNRVKFNVNNYMGFSVTPNNVPGATDPWNLYMGGNRTGNALHFTYDGNVTATTSPGDPLPATSQASVACPSTGTVAADNLVEAIAVDSTNQVMYKAQVHGTGVGPICETDGTNETNITMWTSTDQGQTWIENGAWGNNLSADLGADSAGSALGVSLDKDFVSPSTSGGNPSGHVWVSVSNLVSGVTTGVNKIVHVDAATGHIVAADTIDVTKLTVPTGTQAIAVEAAHYLSVSPVGNIGVIVRNNGGTDGAYWGVLAPNTAGPTTDSVAAVLQPLLGVQVTSNHATVGNTGSATLTFTANITDPGAQAGTAVVTGDLSAVGGPNPLTLTKSSESADHKTATFSGSYLVPTTATLGVFDLPFKAVVGSKSLTVTVNQGIYQAYVPLWTKSVDGAVNSSPAANGTVAYIGTDSGKVYAFNSGDGTPVTGFGSGGVVTLGESVKDSIVSAYGKLYVVGTNHVFILASGSGATLGTSPAITAPTSVIVNPDGTKAYVAAGDNEIHAINAITGAATGTSADLGAPVNRVSIIPTAAVDAGSNPVGYLIVAGTENITGTGGKIVMLSIVDLSQVFAPIVDPKGAVRGRAVYIMEVSGIDLGHNAIAIGGASGLWGINADTGLPLGNANDSWGLNGTAQNGNPYATPTPVDANPAAGFGGDSGSAPVFAYATAAGATGAGQISALLASDGERVSFGGVPIPLTPVGSGFAAGSGILRINGDAFDASGAAIYEYIGSDAVDQRFFGVQASAETFTYSATADKKHIFDPKDTTTFGSGYTPGGFASTPAMAGTTVAVGSAAAKVYGFASLNTAPSYVTSVVPANGATGVATSQVVTLVFSRDLAPTSLLTGSAPPANLTDTIRVVDTSNGQDVAGTLTEPDTKTVVFTPTTALSSNKTYAIIALGATDTATPPAPVQPFSSTFYTGIPPVVKGDINGDGVFDAKDVKEALKIAAGLEAASHAAITAGDFYKPGTKTPDGKITIEDALFLSRVLAARDTLP